MNEWDYRLPLIVSDSVGITRESNGPSHDGHTDSKQINIRI